MSREYKARKGFTVAELAVVTMILGIIMLFFANLMSFNARSLAESDTEFTVQSKVKTATQTAVNELRYATALFILPESGFKASARTKGWNYFGVENTDAGSEIVQYIYNKTTENHDKKILLGAAEDVEYKIYFKKYYEDINDKFSNKDKMVQFEIRGYRGTNKDNYFKVDTAAHGLNTLQVIDWASGYSTDPDIPIGAGIALAYSRDDLTTSTVSTDAYITLVLDGSGSMVMPENMIPESDEPGAKKVLPATMLRKIVLTLLDDFSEFPNVNIAIIPYSDTADPGYLATRRAGEPYLTFYNDMIQGGGYEFYKPSETAGMKVLKDIIAVEYEDLRGATNTADGMRRAHYLLEKGYSPSKGTLEQQRNEYVILFTDGNENAVSYNVSYNWGETMLEESNIKTDDTNVLPDSIVSPGSETALEAVQGLYMFGGEFVKNSLSTGDPHQDYDVVVLAHQESFYGASLRAHSVMCLKYSEKIGNMMKSRKDLAASINGSGSASKFDQKMFIVAVSEGVNAVDRLAYYFNVEEEDADGRKYLFKATNAAELINFFDNIKNHIISDLWFIDGPAIGE